MVDRIFGRHPRHRLQGRAAPRRRARSRGVVAPDGGAARAAGAPRAGLAGAARRRPERRRRRPAHHDPRGHRELAAGAAAARRGAAGVGDHHELLGADGRGHRRPAGRARGQGPRAGRAHHPRGDRADAGERADRGGAPARRDQVRVAARLRHRDLRGPRQRLRPRRDHLDARRRAAATSTGCGKITREQIRDAARRYLSRTDYARIAFVPKKP